MARETRDDKLGLSNESARSVSNTEIHRNCAGYVLCACVKPFTWVQYQCPCSAMCHWSSGTEIILTVRKFL
jgi:hypothetical protein